MRHLFPGVVERAEEDGEYEAHIPLLSRFGFTTGCPGILQRLGSSWSCTQRCGVRRVIDGRERIWVKVCEAFEVLKAFGWAEGNEEALGLGNLHFLLVSGAVSVYVCFGFSVVS
jgi:hypothetical protein